MQYSFLGFSVSKMVEFKLDMKDMAILRFFIDFRETGKMKAEVLDDNTYYWVNYNTMVEEMPFLELGKRTIMNRMLKLRDLGILTHYSKKEGGTFSYFALGPKYIELISNSNSECVHQNEQGVPQNEQGVPQNVEGVYIKTDTGCPSKCTTKIHLLNNQSNNIYSQDDESSDNRVPYNEIIKLFNDICKSLPKVRARSKVRDKKIKSMFRELGIENIQELFNRVEGSSFLSGKTGKWENCNFDWIVKQSNYIKVLEGTYDDKDKCNTPKEESNESTNNFNIILQEDM
ncbi:hypothetical protein OIM93_06875 [Clostridium chauvoei]|uniref:hypothetical protein n=1 Tax=Clostridium chauvoei TaxID=46867 RepID=UPI0020793C85|nr:hypothetical protein [Clostridium chauvoei]